LGDDARTAAHAPRDSRHQMIASLRLLLLVELASGAPYVGDGQLIDRGRFVLIHRYEVRFGTVNVGTGDQKRFEFRGLPHRELVLGLLLDRANCELMKSDAVVSFTMLDERGRAVIREERRLRDLSWGHPLGDQCDSPFGYVPTTAREPARSGCLDSSAFIPASSGQGTSFVGRSDSSYQLTIKIYPARDGSAVRGAATVVMQDDGDPPPCPRSH
jgi:hypothetical protein